MDPTSRLVKPSAAQRAAAMTSMKAALKKKTDARKSAMPSAAGTTKPPSLATPNPATAIGAHSPSNLTDASLLQVHPPALSLPGVSANEVGLRLLLHQESHMASMGPAALLGLLKAILYLLFTALFAIWWMQGTLLYMPTFGRSGESRLTPSNPAGFRSPSEYGIKFEEVYFPAADGVVVHAWLLLQEKAEVAATAPTLMFFHGNAGNIGYRLPNLRSLYITCACNIFIVEYRGYGNSGGECSEAGLMMDAEAALAWLREGRSSSSSLPEASSGSGSSPPIDLSRLYIFGRSLGGAVALHLAAKDCLALERRSRESSARGSHANQHPPLAGVLVENTFLNLAEIVLVLAARLGIVKAESEAEAAETSALLASSGGAPSSVGGRRWSHSCWRSFLRLFMTNHWNSSAQIGHITCPILFLSGLADELIPSTHMAALYAAATKAQARVLHTVPHGTHNDTHIRGGMEYYDTIRAFFSNSQRMAESRSRTQGIQIGAASPTATR